MAVKGAGVFISYRRATSWGLARLVYSYLVERGYDVFMDVENVDSGRFGHRILAEIEQREHFLVILQPDTFSDISSSSTDWMQAEISHALNHECNIVPLVADGFQFGQNRTVPTEISQLAGFNAVTIHPDYFVAAMERLVQRFLRDQDRRHSPHGTDVEEGKAPGPRSQSPASLTASVGEDARASTTRASSQSRFTHGGTSASTSKVKLGRPEIRGEAGSRTSDALYIEQPLKPALSSSQRLRQWSPKKGHLVVIAGFLIIVVITVMSLIYVRKAPGSIDSEVDVAQIGRPPAQPNNAVLPTGNGGGSCAPGTSIAYVGAITGSNAALGSGIVNATELAVNQHNRANPGCQVGLVKADSGGSPDTALGPTQAVINNPAVLGVVGLPFSGESRAVGPALNAAGLVNITPSASKPSLTQDGWQTFFRGVGNDGLQGLGAARWIKARFNPHSVCVINDDSDYGIGLATAAAEGLGSIANCRGYVKTNQTDFSAIVGQVEQVNPQVVYYAGYYVEAAPLVQQLREAGVQAAFVATDGVKDAAFVTGAAGAADGAYITCPCVPQEGFTAFSQAYQQAYGTPPQTYSAEAYDAATILLSGIDRGATSRPELLRYVRTYSGQGLTKKYEWQPNGELGGPPVYVYRVDGNNIVTDSLVT